MDSYDHIPSLQDPRHLVSTVQEQVYLTQADDAKCAKVSAELGVKFQNPGGSQPPPAAPPAVYRAAPPVATLSAIDSDSGEDEESEGSTAATSQREGESVHGRKGRSKKTLGAVAEGTEGSDPAHVPAPGAAQDGVYRMCCLQIRLNVVVAQSLHFDVAPVIMLGVKGMREVGPRAGSKAPGATPAKTPRKSTYTAPMPRQPSMEREGHPGLSTRLARMFGRQGSMSDSNRTLNPNTSAIHRTAGLHSETSNAGATAGATQGLVLGVTALLAPTKNGWQDDDDDWPEDDFTGHTAQDISFRREATMQRAETFREYTASLTLPMASMTHGASLTHGASFGRQGSLRASGRASATFAPPVVPIGGDTTGLTGDMPPFDDDFTQSSSEIWKGRPDLDELLTDVAAEAKLLGEKYVALMICGTGPVVAKVRALAAKGGYDGVQFDVHHEAFGFG